MANNPADPYYKDLLDNEKLFNSGAGDKNKTTGGVSSHQEALNEERLEGNNSPDSSEFNFNNRFEGAGETSGKVSFALRAARLLKKGGPTAFITGSLLTAFIGMMTAILPGAIPMQILELVTEKLNYQDYSASVRLNKLGTYRYTKMSDAVDLIESKNSFFGFGKKQYRFSSLSDAQISKLNANNVNVEAKDGLFGRKRVVAIEIDDIDGKKIRFDQAADFQDFISKNPIWAERLKASVGGSRATQIDGVANWARRLFGINTMEPPSARRDAADTDESKSYRQALDEDLNKKVAGDIDASYSRPGFEDIPEEEVEDVNKRLGAVDESLANAKSTRETGSATSRNNIGKLAGLLDKASDTCSIYNVVKHAIYVSKITKAAQLARYAMAYLSIASAIKSGDATEEQTSYMLNKFMATNPIEGAKDGMRTVVDYRPTAVDSQGLYYLLTGKMGEPNESVKKYQLGINEPGALATFLSIEASLKAIARPLGISVVRLCQLLDSPFSQGVSFVLQGAICVITGGVGCALKVADMVGIVGSMVMMAGLASWVATEIHTALGASHANSSTVGEDAMNAMVSGSGSYLSKMSMGGGNMPLTQSGALAYMEERDNYIAEQAEIIRATHSPFDVSTRHTMLGSIVSNGMPYFGRMNSLAGGISGLISYAGSSLKTGFFGGTALAAANDLADRKAAFNLCADPEYRAYAGLDGGSDGGKVALDPFCNFVVGVPIMELNSPEYAPHEVLEYLAPRTFKQDPKRPGRVTSELEDYRLEYKRDEEGNLTNLEELQQQGGRISAYFNAVLGDDQGCGPYKPRAGCNVKFKPVDKYGRDCHLGPIIVGGELITRGFSGPYSDGQSDNPCYTHSPGGLNYEFEWVIDDRNSMCANYKLAVRENGIWKHSGARVCPDPDEGKRGNMIQADYQNKLLSFKHNCISRGHVPLGTQMLQDRYEGEETWANMLFKNAFGEIIEDGRECILGSGSKDRIMMALYFMDERVQCMIDNGKDCDAMARP